jgi:hypothetical protein
MVLGGSVITLCASWAARPGWVLSPNYLVLTLNRSILRATSLKGRLDTTYCGIELLVLTYSSRNFYILLILENQGPRAYDLRTHTRSGLGLSCTISVALKIAPRRP